REVALVQDCAGWCGGGGVRLILENSTACTMSNAKYFDLVASSFCWWCAISLDNDGLSVDDLNLS
ncbi:hypothetical protein, partial [Gulosibacter macacae]|uniref:hypothetical protein n=1 Tax=Gulosibacter macacae TaxID=2488791 RepID=UPI001BDFEB90